MSAMDDVRLQLLRKIHPARQEDSMRSMLPLMPIVVFIAGCAPRQAEKAGAVVSDQTRVGTVQVAPGLASPLPYDGQFLDAMIEHHAVAVTWGKDVAARAQHAELRELAEKIATSQAAEIEQMKAWRLQWYPDTAAVAPADRPAMQGNEGAMATSGPASESQDQASIDEMIAHHRKALEMAARAESEAVHPELRELARSIEATQRAEIDLMEGWRKQWFGA
jgi:uncharacterized protein (DUF305 family)